MEFKETHRQTLMVLEAAQRTMKSPVATRDLFHPLFLCPTDEVEEVVDHLYPYHRPYPKRVAED